MIIAQRIAVWTLDYQRPTYLSVLTIAHEFNEAPHSKAINIRSGKLTQVWKMAKEIIVFFRWTWWCSIAKCDRAYRVVLSSLAAAVVVFFYPTAGEVRHLRHSSGGFWVWEATGMMERHHAIHGKTHYFYSHNVISTGPCWNFDWVIFNSKVLGIARG